MNKVILMGRLTAHPDIRQSQNGQVARYKLAVDRVKGEADFIPCVAFGKSAEFADKYLKQGTKVVVVGRIQTGSYTNRDGKKVYTTDVIIESQEFAESKKYQDTEVETIDEFTNKLDEFVDVGDEDGLPFN